MEHSTTRIPASLVATTMIVVGAVLAPAAIVPAIVLVSMGTLLILDLAGAVQPSAVRATHRPLRPPRVRRAR